MTRQKWRPPLAAIVVTILVAVLALPLAGLFFFRLYENQLIRQAESELIAQGAAIAAIYEREVRAAGIPADKLGAILAADLIGDASEPYRPIEPVLDLAADTVLGRRPDAATPEIGPDPALAAIGTDMTPVLLETQRTTLAGFRLLDAQGIVIGGRDELGLSLAHVEEIRTALAGRHASALRLRVSDQAPPPLYSVSRGTKVRVFVALPAVVDGRVAGVVYLSRTPNNIVKHLYGERGKVALAAAAMLGTTLLIALVFIRTISRPMRELRDRTSRIAAGDSDAIQPLGHHGTREMAELATAFLDMARKLQTRSDTIRTFAAHVSHELKSPLSSILGAAELLRDSGGEMSETERQRFSENIVADAGRLNLLVRRLLDLARAEGTDAAGTSCQVGAVLAGLHMPKGLELRAGADGVLTCRIAAENLAIMIGHLADNSARHGARTFDVSAEEASGTVTIRVTDDGDGIGAGDRARIFQPFFTTRRESGGTGMGLTIVAALAKAHGGTIEVLETAEGAGFAITLPAG